MYIYKQLIKLFRTETAFKIVKIFAKLANRIPFGLGVALYSYKPVNSLGQNLFSLYFSNPVGLGPGLDRKGMMYNEFGAFGYSFVEIGPVSEFNLKEVITRLCNNPRKVLVSICINRDYEKVFSLSYDFADMFDFQIPDEQIIEVLSRILDIRLGYDCYKPVILRLNHEIPADLFKEVIDFCRLNGIDAIAVGKTKNVRMVSKYTNGNFYIIGYGELRSPQAVAEMLDAGASLVQITTGMVLDGPSIVKRTLKYLDNSISNTFRTKC